jgi:hypothetical protein
MLKESTKAKAANRMRIKGRDMALVGGKGRAKVREAPALVRDTTDRMEHSSFREPFS